MRSWMHFLILALMFTVLSAINPLQARGQEDICKEKGIVVRNLTTNDHWYKKNDGDCFKWKVSKMFVIKPGDTVDIYSDLTCKTTYCKGIDYEKYLSYDKNGNCRVKIIPGCTLSDM
ncbi:MAG TPA: hypothetical protein ENI58_04470 [Nitrospirae bacterium]|nr:hypothetical protein [Nitrospirota bacterium]